MLMAEMYLAFDHRLVSLIKNETKLAILKEPVIINLKTLSLLVLKPTRLIPIFLLGFHFTLTRMTHYLSACISFYSDPNDAVNPEPEVVFDERARNVSIVIERFNANCPGTISDEDAEELSRIATEVIGAAPIVNNNEIIGLDNAIPHTAFPSSVIFDTSSPTYHHYDIRHKLCSFESSNSVERLCPPLAVMEQEHSLYTLPTRKQLPTPPRTDGSFAGAFGPILTAVADFSDEALHPRDSYLFRVGRVTQQRIATSGARYPQVFENITDASHTAFPGIIVRALEVAPDGIYSFTHGEGENRAFCVDGLDNPTGPDLLSVSAVRFIRLIITFANDVYGFNTFHDLDQRLIEDNR